MHGVYEDVRRALRLMARNRITSLAVFLSLALGIGVSTATFGMVNYVLLQQLPVQETHRVVRVTFASPESAVGEFSYPDFADQLLQDRDAIERLFGNLVNWGGGLTTLPAWVRTHRRVHRWVQAKLVLAGLKRGCEITTCVA